MTILQPCPECANVFVFPETQAVSSVQCPRCGTRFRVQKRFLQFLAHTPPGVIPSNIFRNAIDLDTNRKVLLRFPPKAVLNDPEYRAWLESQASVFMEYEHPHAAPYIGLVMSHGEACLLWEDTDQGTLSSRIKTMRRIPEEEVLTMALQIASALKSAVELEYFHGTISPNRIQFDDAGNARLVGLGFPFPIQDEHISEGDILYLAPECLNDIGDYRSDIYGLGACMFHALTGYPPMACSPNTKFDIIQKMKRTTVPIPILNPPISDATSLLLTRMMAADVSMRLSSYDELISSLLNAQRLVATRPILPVTRSTGPALKAYTPRVAGTPQQKPAITRLIGFFQPKRAGNSPR